MSNSNYAPYEAKDDDYLSSPFERDESLIIKIGITVTLWGTISNILRSLASKRLACSTDQADVILSQFSGENSRIQFLISLLEAQDALAYARIIAALRGLTSLTNERNLIVHGGPFWGMKLGFYPPGFHYRNFKQKKADKKVTAAHNLLDGHLKALREKGSELHRSVYSDEFGAFEHLNL